jgi:ABC-type Fe3+ transport system substrate-binding protein
MRSATRQSFPVLAAVIAAGLGLGTTAGTAADLSAAEKLYVELSKMDPAARAAKIEEGAKKEGTLVNINALGGSLGTGFNKIFEQKFTYIKLQPTALGAQDSAGRMVDEEATGNHITDISGTTVPDMALAMEKDVEAKYPTPVIDRILPRYNGFKDPTGQNRWVPFMWSEHGITYNPKMLKPEDYPKSWEDMCKPVFKGQISFDPPETRFLVGLYQLLGDEKTKEWLACVGKNDPIIQRGHTTRLMLMMAGDHAASPDQYLYQGTAENRKNPAKAPFAAAYTAPILAYAAVHLINKNTPHPYASALWSDWALSDEPQEYLGKALRAPIAIKHPFIPDEATVFPFSYVDAATIDKLFKYWNDGIRKTR